MTCQDRLAELLPLYAAGTLDEKDRQAVAQHLAACPACRALVESHRSLVEALGDLAAPEPPADFALNREL